jgi:UDP-N-acetyl-D-glucosamine dehydrogenase
VDPLVAPRYHPASARPAVLDESNLRWADVVVLVTDHDAFDSSLVVRSARQVLDTRHCLPAAANVEYL